MAGVRVNAVCPAGVLTPLMREWADTQYDPKAALAMALELGLPVRTPVKAREIVDDLNQRIRESYTRLQSGPRIIVALVDTEKALTAWRERRAPRG